MVGRLAVFAFLLSAVAAAAGPARGPDLGAAANFGQSWAPEMLDAAAAAGITLLRDEIHWDAVERDGQYGFDQPLTTYPDEMAARGMRLMLIAGGTHPDHDAGVTPYTPEAVAAYAAAFAGMAERFPAVAAVEVGNEMNSETFTAGPARDADIAGRAEYYAALLHATHDAVRAARPGLRIIGGAAHSIPLAWFTALSDLGAAAWMDAVAIHPYNTPPEQFRRQAALLRAVPGFETLPIEVTETGTTEAASAPALLMKSHCQMALAGVASLTWYPLADRGDGYAPLLDATGALTDVGHGWQLIQRELAGLPVQDVAPDPFTYACAYGDRALVIWGAERAVTLDDPGLIAVDATGRLVGTPRLSNAAPLLVLGAGATPRLGDNVRLGAQKVVADSYDQFAYPGHPGDGFARFARAGEETIPFVLGPGQQAGGVPWTPYLTTVEDGSLRMDANFLLPSFRGDLPAEIVHAFAAPEAMAVSVEASVAPTAESSDGVVVGLRLNGESLGEEVVTGARVLTEPRLDLGQGDVLEIIVGPGASAAGDATTYRFTLRRVE